MQTLSDFIDTEEKALNYAMLFHKNIQQDGFQDYIPQQAQRLKGGVANFVYRIILVKQNGITNDNETYILKMYPSFLASNPDFSFSQQRILVEYQALGLINAHQDDWKKNTNFRVPKILYFDIQNYVIIMQDIGQNLISLQDLFLKSDGKNLNSQFINEVSLESVALNLKSFLQQVFQMQLTEQDKNIFQNEIAWKAMRDFTSTISNFYDKYPQIKEFVEKLEPFGPSQTDEKKSLILGDLWPNSVYIDIDSKSFWVIDWEISRIDSFQKDFNQMMSNLWIMTQNKQKYDEKRVLTFMNSLSQQYLDSQIQDWRNKSETAKGEFLRQVILLAQFPHWEIASMEALIYVAISQIKSLN